MSMAVVARRWSNVLSRDTLAGWGQRARAELSEAWDHIDLFDETEVERQKTNPLYLLGPMFYLFWVITMVSGVWLIIFYVPNTTWAFNSIHRIQHEVWLGWLFRGIHKYGADALIIAATIRVYRLYFTGEYKRKPLTWGIAFMLLLFGMYSGLTGYLLIWVHYVILTTRHLINTGFVGTPNLLSTISCVKG
jgi:quinol-cytochrome oxidoreductase complex cytochrome b subunit